MDDLSISVGMTTFNSARFIKKQLMSIIEQSRPPDEIVIVDDCSEDDTVEILNEVIKSCKNIKVKLIVNESNIGFVKNFEKCFLSCSGDIIFSSDADDIWDKNKIQVISKYFQNKDVSMVYHDAYVIDENENIIMKSLYMNYYPLIYKNGDEFIERCIKKGGHPFGMTIAFRKICLDFIAPFPFAHDEWISLCMPVFGNVIYVNDKLTYYRRHGNNLSGDNNLNKSKIKKLITKIKKSSKEQWYIYPSYQYEGYCRYLKLFENKLSKNNILLLKNEIKFKRYCIDIINSNRLRGVILLLKCYKSNTYKIFRGNIKMLIIDLIYIFLH